MSDAVYGLRPRTARVPGAVIALLVALSSGTLARGAAAQAPEAAGKNAAEAHGYGYWSTGEPRWFVSTRSELGILYAKPYFSAGYGKPHWIWGGVDLNAMSTPEFAQVHTGVRAATPILDLAFALRDTWSYQKPFLMPATTFSRSDVIGAPGPSAHYLAWEGEVDAYVPLPHSLIVANWIYVRTLEVPRGRYLYEEDYRAIVADPTFYLLRVVAGAQLLRENALKVGFMTEYVFGTGREHGVVRVGPVGLLQITDHLQVQGGVTFAVYSPDRLGLTLGAYAVAGFRYQWASCERKPEPPWRGRFIP